jgi:hypothetical protein
MSESDMMVLLLALCKLTGVKAKATAIQEALKDARSAVGLLHQGQNPYGQNPPR